MKLKDIILDWLQWNEKFLVDLQNRKLADKKSGAIGALKVRNEVLSESKPLFCLSTGRAGTKYLTEALKNCSDLNIFHEPNPEFIFHNKWAYECKNLELKKASFDAGRYEHMRETYLLGKQYMETNTRIAFYCDAIAKLYPKSKFVYLQRDCKAFVKSGLARNWYDGHVYDEGRIVYSNSNVWKDWSQVQKISWLWCETNNFIEAFLSKLDESRYISVSAKEMFKSARKQSEIAKFLGISGVKWPSKKVNKSKVKSVELTSSEILEMEAIINKFYTKAL